MNEYVIVTDSTTDISAKMVQELGVIVVPLKFTIEGKTYVNVPDGGEMDIRAFYQKLRQGNMSTTSQVNSEEFIDYFEPALKDGKDILYIGFSSGLSGTYQSAVMAAGELGPKYPERKIQTFDSLCASMGEGLLVYLACMLKAKGRDMDYIYSWLKLNALSLCHWFTVDDLHHLKRGGRVSSAAAMVGTMLGIKPVLHVDNEGHLIPVAKIRGRKQALDAIVKRMEDAAVNPSEQTVFISHGDCIEDAEYVAAQVKNKFKPNRIVINHVGPVIGAHSGPGTVALFFIGTER